MAAEAHAAGRAEPGAAPDDTVHALRQQIALLEDALAEARSARDVGRTSEDRFRSLFDMSRDGIVFVDLEGHIEEMNQAYLDLVGYGRDEITTHTYQDLTPEKWRAGEAKIIETQVMQRGFSDEYEKEYVRKDGSIAPISLRTILVRDLDGRPVRFMGIVRDITELKEQEEALKASEKRYRGLFDLSHDGVVFVGLDGPIEEANPAYLDMLGYDLDELIGVTYQQLTPARWDEMEAEIVERQLMSRGYTDEYEKEYIRKEGSIFPVAVRSILVRDETGTPVRIMGVVRDITEQKQAKEALERHARDLARSNEELEQFAYVASHDLQEPLRKIRAFGALLADEKRENLDDEGQQYIDFMTDAAARMQTLVSDLLALSRVTTAAQPFEDLALGEVFDTVLSDLSVALEEAGGEVEVAATPTVEADRTQMEQLFRNLIGNAVKFRRPGVAPRVTVEVAKEAERLDAIPGPAHTIVVTDNGIGFDSAQGGKLFQPFKRLHARHQYEGAGIGLAICEKIVLRHHGRITASGTPGEGAVFTVTLPRRQPR
ncbi:MAG: PAS domain S-box protein [Rhodospirillales bacterium]|nr:PAS domain S-box protein [Rhodospirillales bacterium]MDE0379805.1 PAS domain S-box protein [Rhodospirillales bacterium]